MKGAEKKLEAAQSNKCRQRMMTFNIDKGRANLNENMIVGIILKHSGQNIKKFGLLVRATSNTCQHSKGSSYAVRSPQT